MTEKSLSIHASFDQELLSCVEKTERILEVVVRAPEEPRAAHRPPLNLALVLDRSGSMNGAKLRYVKQAAAHVLDLMGDGDRVAAVQYDDKVDVLFHSAPLDALIRTGLQQRLQSIQSGGSTNLSGGWLQGCAEVAEAAVDGAVNRALLLTDGLANVGITSLYELQNHARELAARGVATSTFGVGLDFNHELLDAMASHGEGRFYFIESPDDISPIFEQEFKDLAATYARDIEVTLCCPPDWGVEVAGGWRHDLVEAGQTRVSLGSLAAGASRELHFKLTVPAGEAGLQAQVIARLMARGTAVAGADAGVLIAQEARAALRWAAPAEVEAAPKNEQVLERYAKIDLADQAAKALEMERRGERQGASNALYQAAARHRDRIDPELYERYEGTAARMRQGLEERDRKRTHQDAYNQRHRHEEFGNYPLISQVLGHLVIQVRSHPFLLNTGSPVSIGGQGREAWNFLGRHVYVKQDFLGVTTEYLERVLRTRIDVMLGMDVLRELSIHIDTQDGVVHFNRDHISELPIPVYLDTVMGVPTARVNLAGAKRMVFIDTSARLCYLPRTALDGLQTVDTEKDFYPGFGEFETPVVMVPLALGGDEVMLRCGVLPELLEKTLEATGVEGILGVELFDRYAASFNFRKGMLTLERHPNRS